MENWQRRKLKLLLLYTMGIVILMFSVMEGMVSTEIKVSPSNDKPDSGSAFTFAVSVKPETNVAGLQMSVNFNPQAMSVTDVKIGNFLGDPANVWFSAGKIDNAAGTVKDIYAACLGAGNYATAEGVFIVITCKALASGQSSSVTLSNVIVGNKDGQAVPFALYITQAVIRSVYDLNGDGKVDRLDMLRAIETQADFNGDGIHNVLDLILLGQNFT